ncbi:MAG TPA: hypothetical protein VJJ02_01525 [Candidatus Paceibacterota bacterium]
MLGVCSGCGRVVPCYYDSHDKRNAVVRHVDPLLYNEFEKIEKAKMCAGGTREPTKMLYEDVVNAP